MNNSNIDLSNINLISDIASDIKLIKKSISNSNSIEKRWLNVKECASYLGYSKDRIYALCNDEFINGTHFYKKGKLLFDRLELDKWVMQVSIYHNTVEPIDIAQKVLDDIENKS